LATVFGLIVNCRARPRTEGMRAPAPISPFAILIRTASTICLLIERVSPVAMRMLSG
jgi:hypothetical protein